MPIKDCRKPFVECYYLFWYEWETAIRHENITIAVMCIAKRNLYFYFDLCKTPPF